MTAWLHTLAGILSGGGRAVVVTLAEAKGSSPREVGARMLVHAGGLDGSIGGGRLEHEATVHAGRMLAGGGPAFEVVRYWLGPELGQCCGGTVRLAFERIEPDHRAIVDEALARLGATGHATIATTGSGDRIDKRLLDQPPDPLPPAGSMLAPGTAGVAVLVDILEDRRPALWLFGAGHVGRAIVEVLGAELVRITWVDTRREAFPDPLPQRMRCLCPGDPVALVDAIEPGAAALVMTHSHDLDQAICGALLTRDDLGLVGLIGSGTKRARFEQRWRAEGLGEPRMARLVSPIGLPGIVGKSPRAIAIAAAAQLLHRAGRRNDG